MGCCGSRPSNKASSSRSNANETAAAVDEEFAYAKLHKLVESALPNSTLEVLTVFPAAFSLSAASAVLGTSADKTKERLAALEEKKLLQLSGNDLYILTPMVRNYVSKLAGESNQAHRGTVVRTYIHLVTQQMQQLNQELEGRSAEELDTAVQQQYKADFTEVLVLIAKRCGTDEGLLEEIGAPDSLQNSNVYAALSLWSHAATMWSCIHRVMQSRLSEPHEPPAPLVSGEEDPNFSTQHALATCAYNQGEAHRALNHITEAEDCYKDAFRVWEGVLPDEDPRMMCCLSLIAACLKARRDMASAEQCYERLFAACQRVLPPNHPEFLHAVKELAECLEAQGKVKEAQPLKALAFKSF